MTNTYGNEHFATSNFYLAVYLHVKGLQLTDIDRSTPRRSQFVFVDSPQRAHLVKRFTFAEKNSPDVMVDAREYEIAMKILKNKLYQDDQERSESTG